MSGCLSSSHPEHRCEEFPHGKRIYRCINTSGDFGKTPLLTRFMTVALRFCFFMATFFKDHPMLSRTIAHSPEQSFLGEFAHRNYNRLLSLRLTATPVFVSRRVFPNFLKTSSIS